jgi:hypothetical protein
MSIQNEKNPLENLAEKYRKLEEWKNGGIL